MTRRQYSPDRDCSAIRRIMMARGCDLPQRGPSFLTNKSNYRQNFVLIKYSKIKWEKVKRKLSFCIVFGPLMDILQWTLFIDSLH